MAALSHGVRRAPRVAVGIAVAATLAAMLVAIPAGSGAQAPTPVPTPVTAPAAGPAREVVVLAHGMGRTKGSMRPLADALEKDGFTVFNFGYSSTCCTIPELAVKLRASVDSLAAEGPVKVHFVGHSLGNIIVRWMLAHDSLPERRAFTIGRLVMLAPPNQGSAAADRYAGMIGWFLKPIGELRTDSASTVRSIPPLAGVQIGVISGRSDGKVSVEESHLPEETDHVIVDGAHSFLMNHADVQQLTIRFLRTGKFADKE